MGRPRRKALSEPQRRFVPETERFLAETVARFLGETENPRSSDALNGFVACEVMARYEPSLLAVNFGEIDLAHQGSSSLYTKAIRNADCEVALLGEQIEKLPAYRDGTVLVVVPDHGQNLGGIVQFRNFPQERFGGKINGFPSATPPERSPWIPFSRLYRKGLGTKLLLPIGEVCCVKFRPSNFESCGAHFFENKYNLTRLRASQRQLRLAKQESGFL